MITVAPRKFISTVTCPRQLPVIASSRHDEGSGTAVGAAGPPRPSKIIFHKKRRRGIVSVVNRKGNRVPDGSQLSLRWGHPLEAVSHQLQCRPLRGRLVTAIAWAQIEKIDSPSLQKRLESGLQAVRNPFVRSPGRPEGRTPNSNDRASSGGGTVSKRLESGLQAVRNPFVRSPGRPEGRTPNSNDRASSWGGTVSKPVPLFHLNNFASESDSSEAAAHFRGTVLRKCGA